MEFLLDALTEGMEVDEDEQDCTQAYEDYFTKETNQNPTKCLLCWQSKKELIWHQHKMVATTNELNQVRWFCLQCTPWTLQATEQEVLIKHFENKQKHVKKFRKKC